MSQISKNGTDRTLIYEPLFKNNNCLINKSLIPGFESLFYEPFYQLMRQQFLAHEMEKAKELGADIVSVLHIAPAHNTDFRRVTSPYLTSLGETATSVWKKILLPNGRFYSVSTEELFGRLAADRLPEMKSWLDYINTRYSWVRTNVTT